jgi:hypothetical protein
MPLNYNLEMNGKAAYIGPVVINIQVALQDGLKGNSVVSNYQIGSGHLEHSFQ